MRRGLGGAAVARRLLRAVAAVAATAALVGMVAYAVGHVGLTKNHRDVDLAGALPAPPADVVPVRWRPDELRWATRPGRICVTDARHGRICTTFAAGQMPAAQLIVEIRRRGLRIRGSV